MDGRRKRASLAGVFESLDEFPSAQELLRLLLPLCDDDGLLRGAKGIFRTIGDLIGFCQFDPLSRAIGTEFVRPLEVADALARISAEQPWEA